jgi:hypothetical protein
MEKHDHVDLTLGHSQQIKVRIHGVQGAKIQTKVIEHLFNGIYSKHFHKFSKDIGTSVEEAFRAPNRRV